jgi:acylpyruvate hydrolase
MKLATLRIDGTTAAVRVDDTSATVIDGYPDLSALLGAPDWESLARHASGRTVGLDGADYAPVVPRPGKIVCVGLNYATHIKEMGRDLPEYPTLFAKFADALTGPYDDVVLPEYAATQLDWEAELAFVIGQPAYQVSEADADGYIAGYSVINDYRLGSRIETRLDGELMQSATTDDLVFSPATLVEYISHIVTLNPGDVVITGTTGGVGHARKPARYIGNGQTVEVSIEGLGTVRNTTIVK